MRILLLGKFGQLGWELRRSLATLGEIAARDYPEIDLTRGNGIQPLIEAVRPDVVVNATAYTAVDQAESAGELVQTVNGRAPGLLAEATRATGALLIHYSTDYVFDGTLGRPYREDDLPHPLGAYGRSKLAGEQAIQQVDGPALIFRTSWVYSLRRETFVRKVLQWSRQQAQLRVVDDQVSNPTWARMLAEITAQLLASAHSDLAGWARERRGLYHLAGSGYTSRLEWARAILQRDPHPEEQIVQALIPAKTCDFPTPARRPLFSALNCDRFTDTFGLRLPDWETALGLAMEAEAR